MEQCNVLVVDDEAVIREGLRRILEDKGYAVQHASRGNLALEELQQNDFDLVLTDLKMPGMGGMEVLKTIRVLQPAVPVIIITGYATIETAVEAMRKGAFDYLSKPFEPGQILDKVEKALEQREILLEHFSAAPAAEDEEKLKPLLGRSPSMQKVFRRILQVAPTDSTVLITGESGTGKELAARAIHRNSSRRDRSFVAVDCTSLAENLLESELFGHIKGSFTGATQSKPGLFKVADGGTLFLDEIANISLPTQAKLLRVLQQREVTPIGGTSPIPIDIRLVAATNRNLKDMVNEGEFREDLFFRLNIIPVDLPPLRERKDDLELLTRHFLEKFSGEIGKEIRGLSSESFAMLENYEFPGNVRELENLIERAVVLAEEDLVHKDNLELQGSRTHMAEPDWEEAPGCAEELKEKKRQIREQAVTPIEKAFVLGALGRNGWNVTRAAEDTGMARPNFQALLKKHEISVRDRTSSENH